MKRELAKQQRTNGDILQSSFGKLVEACKRKDLAEIKRTLDARPELINQRDKYDRTLLHYAAILMLDGTINEPREDPQSNRRSNAKDEAYVSDSLDCFQYLSDQCDPKLWCQVDLDGLSLLHLAVISCNVPLVKLVVYEHKYSHIDKLSLVNKLDCEKHSPLHWAVITNNLHCVKLLVGHSGVVLAHQADLNGATPLHYATQTSDFLKYREQLRRMLKCATASNEDGDESSIPADGSREFNSIARQQTTIQAQASSSIDQANGEPSRSGRTYEILEYLINLTGINLECCDNDRRTPLHWAASSGHRAAICLLLEKGANPFCQDANNLGPLHCAASHGYTDCLESLLNLTTTTKDSGAPDQADKFSSIINQPDNLNCTPLFYAVLSGNVDCVELFLDRGAERDWQDVKGRTVAHFAALKGQLNILKLLEARGANLWLANKQGDLPLHYAIKSGRLPVISWLLEHSPYERAVNAINNVGRAPIHLAVMKNNPPLVEYLIKRGANLNQLVKMRDKSSGDTKRDLVDLKLVNQTASHQTKGGSVYRYETALDLANRLNCQDCSRLLEQHSAQPADKILRSRPPTLGSHHPASNVRSVFDLQAADVASPIGFETGSSSAEPQSEHLPDSLGGLPSTATKLQPKVDAAMDKVPKMPQGPRSTGAAIPQSDSTGSSALSQSSLTSLRGVGTNLRRLAGYKEQMAPNEAASSQANDRLQQNDQPRKQPTPADEQPAAPHQNKPFKGGISYHNEHMNASIKCKLYGLQQHQQAPNETSKSFPQHSSAGGKQSQRIPASLSLDRSSGPIGLAAVGGQEIITNVHVYTSPCAHCVKCHQLDCSHPQETLPLERQDSRNALQNVSLAVSTSSDSDSTISENIDRVSEHERDYRMVGSLPQLDSSAANTYQPDYRAINQPTQHRLAHAANGLQQQQQQPRYHLPPSQGYSHQLPAILSAEEEMRSTSGETAPTNYDQAKAMPDIGDGTQSYGYRSSAHQQYPLGGETMRVSPTRSPANQEPRFDRAQRVGQRATRNRSLVRSPVAEYIHAPMYSAPRETVEEAGRGYSVQQHQQMDYSQVRAKVDSHRNDSGLSSSHFNEYDGESTSAGRRSKTYSTLSSGRQTVQQQNQFSGDGTRTQHKVSPSRRPYDQSGGGPRTQTIIRTRRLSVDSVELASRVEKSIRKYKQETKLFEELQNLKRSQIRSGKANEALLVKRLVENFRSHTQDLLVKLDPYHGPYTYKSYELYLYEQLRRLSQSNCAKLRQQQQEMLRKIEQHAQELAERGKLAKSDSHEPQSSGELPFDGNLNEAEQRDFLEEDLNAELELRRVIDGSSPPPPQAPATEHDDDLVSTSSFADGDEVVIEPSGALEEIRVKGDTSAEAVQLSEKKSAQVDDTVETKADVQRQLVIHRASTVDQVESDGELETKDTAHLNKTEKSSTTRDEDGGKSSASSRRSSVDIEREKLFDLPLQTRAVSEKLASGLLEQQASELSSSILVDILGNVSRAGSPDRQEQHEEDNQLLDKGDQESPPASPPPLAIMNSGYRRKSVVTIGDKLETIYHAVGIEIEPVAEDELNDEETHKETSDVQLTEPKQDTTGSLERQASEIADERMPDEQEEVSEPSGSNEATMIRKQRKVPIRASESMRLSDSNLKESRLTDQRRASSPPSYVTGAPKKRGSQVDNLEDSLQDGPKRVFNGHDLDELHKSRQASRQSIKDDPAGDSRELEKISRKSPTSFRRHLKRSRIPKRPFVISVPLDEIHSRWTQIKRQERCRKRREQDGDETTSWWQSHKSQPNLKQQAESIDCKRMSLDNSQDCSHYTLIYEINNKHATALAKTKARTAREYQWCQRRLNRIVDVRLLKRTLSLPESLIYSNDLLKRFNILKL